MEQRPSLETRTCACGCGCTFRVLKSSRQRFGSRGCEATGAPRGRFNLWHKPAHVRTLPEDASGLVSNKELAKLLGVSLGTIYLWAKMGKIVRVPGPARNAKFDLAAVRLRLQEMTDDAKRVL